MHGKGVLQYADGRKYAGRGRIIFPILGDFFNDKKEGQGELVENNKKTYKGGFSNGKKHGLGEIFDENDTLLQKGEWAEGKLIKKRKRTIKRFITRIQRIFKYYR